jgi:DNA-binding PadR family transcriptional regulator
MNLLQTSVLSSLASGPRHGYGIVGDIEESTGGRVRSPVGSLYRILDALTRDGLIIEDRSEVVDGRNRRYYRLTPAGQASLLEAVAAMESVVATTRTRLAPRFGTATVATTIGGAR